MIRPNVSPARRADVTTTTWSRQPESSSRRRHPSLRRLLRSAATLTFVADLQTKLATFERTALDHVVAQDTRASARELRGGPEAAGHSPPFRCHRRESASGGHPPARGRGARRVSARAAEPAAAAPGQGCAPEDCLQAALKRKVAVLDVSRREPPPKAA